jgi:hypothetical protein
VRRADADGYHRLADRDEHDEAVPLDEAVSCVIVKTNTRSKKSSSVLTRLVSSMLRPSGHCFTL